jgi:hypothetical protein
MSKWSVVQYWWRSIRYEKRSWVDNYLATKHWQHFKNPPGRKVDSTSSIFAGPRTLPINLRLYKETKHVAKEMIIAASASHGRLAPVDVAVGAAETPGGVTDELRADEVGGIFDELGVADDWRLRFEVASWSLTAYVGVECGR